jgi:hypothetical protein
VPIGCHRRAINGIGADFDAAITQESARIVLSHHLGELSFAGQEAVPSFLLPAIEERRDDCGGLLLRTCLAG